MSKKKISTNTANVNPVDPARVSRLKAGAELPAGTGTHVLYWMAASLRGHDNAALEYAGHLSNRFGVPLRVAHVLPTSDADGHALTERHALFHLEGVVDVAEALRKRRIPFIVIRPAAVESGQGQAQKRATKEQQQQEAKSIVADLARLAKGAVSVVTDTDYLRPGRTLRASFARAVSVPFYVVEANVVVPVAEASQKAEHAARTIRPKINRLVAHYQKVTSQVALLHQEDDTNDDGDDVGKSMWPEEDQEEESQHASFAPDRVVRMTNADDVESILAAWDGVDRGAPRVDGVFFRGGEAAALRRLSDFVEKQLDGYDRGRNEPALQLQSDLSPYLRAGHISPVTIACAVAERATSSNKASRDAFLEELIVRRELAANFCFFNAVGYDSYDGAVPSFAQESLRIHAGDKRPQVYTYEQLEAGVTGDVYWNAAQLELVVRGKMHGYMRMYWAKQIIGWVENPQDALAFTIRLNNRWQLDAVDPNSYVGVAWCYGLHDQGWRERDIWGKVRYMNEAGLKRKFDMPAYVALVDKMIRKHGLPSHIAQIRQQHGSKELVGKQTTIMDAFAKRRAPGGKKKVATARKATTVTKKKSQGRHESDDDDEGAASMRPKKRTKT